MRHSLSRLLLVLLFFLPLPSSLLPLPSSLLPLTSYLFPQQAQAQSYDQLWKQTARAFNDDLPQTALEHLRTIRDRAAAEANTPQLLRALCTEMTVSRVVSVDSSAVVVRRIEEVLARETDPVNRALWQSALGTLTHNDSLLLASISDPERLAAAKATDYVPAFAIGKDSRWFNDDLLSVLTRALIDDYNKKPWSRSENGISWQTCRDAYLAMRGVYERQGNAEALLIADYIASQELNVADCEVAELIQRIRSLAPTMKQGNAQRALMAWVDEQECPTASIHWNAADNAFTSGSEAQGIISSRNVARLEVRLYRPEGITNANVPEGDAKSLLKSRKTRLVATFSKDLQHTEAHKFYDDTLDVQLPEAGIYVAQLWADGKPQDATIMYVSDVTPLFFHASSDAGTTTRMVLVNTLTGKPYTEAVSAKVLPNKHNRLQKTASTSSDWITITPDDKGAFDLSRFSYYDEVCFAAGSDAYHPCVRVGYNNSRWGGSSDTDDTLARLFTDRAIYRPGQTLHVAGLVYNRHGDAYTAQEGWKGTVVLVDTERKDVAEMDVTSDAMGQFAADFTLPSPAIPGNYSVVLRGNGVRHTEYFRIEEYKRPTFHVTLTAPDVRDVTGKERWEVGDSLTLEGLVESFSGVALPETRVLVTTKRHDWMWARHGGNFDGETVICDTLTTDAEGRFLVPLKFTETGRYTTSVEAKAVNGETATAQHSVFVGTPTVRIETENKVRSWHTETISKDGTEARLHIDATALPTAAAEAEDAAPVYIFTDLVTTKGGIIHSECMPLTDSLNIDVKWRDDFGDAATFFIAFVRGGVCYSQSVTVKRPLPDKRLIMEWSTFRDHLQPGQQETWTLTVRRPDGQPADASIMARLYDASLDAFTSRPWNFDLAFDRNVPWLTRRGEFIRNFSLDYTKQLKAGPAFDFTHWTPTIFDYYANMERVRTKGAGSRLMLYETVVADAAPEAPRLMASAREPAGDVIFKEVAVSANGAAAEEAANDADAAAAAAAPVRENFDETAFFLPALRTDADGRVAIAFTLPESLTQWNFSAFAHDTDMNYGLLHDTIVAQKMLMAEINAPRFLRQGDVTEVPVMLRNLSPTARRVELIVVFTDAATGKVLRTEKRTATLDAAKTPGAQASMAFALKATADVKVRAVARTLPDPSAPTAESFADGEERLIPVLSGRELVQVSVPFSVTEEGPLNISLATLGLARLMKQDADCRPTLSVEYCANPIWSVIRVVPQLFEAEAYEATGWATRLYAVEVGDFLARSLRGTPSQTLVDSLLSATDIPALRYAALHHLADFQSGDGGFSWFRGFPSSTWITADVAVLLARQQMLTGSTTAAAMLRRATAYLQREAAEYVKEAKKEKKGDKSQRPAISEVMLRYLYVRQLQGLEPDKDAQYLLSMAADEKKDLSMYGKGLVAQILSSRHPEASALALQSLVEHTVVSPEMGRFFDTERALSGWASYKIPSQTMAIEALESTADSETLYPGVCNEMRLWLLQSKRTQKWESSRASADATYALLHGQANASATGRPFQALVPEDYNKRTLSDNEAKQAIRRGTITLNKDTEGLSWGAVYADYTLPTEMVEPLSAGFAIERRWEVRRNGKWISAEGQKVKVGEHVRQTITVRAERDYDFVQVEASRPACLEPLQPLSGHTWQAGTSAYRMVRDSRNDYFFEHLAKGSHTLTEELIVDRTGQFSTGTAHVRCSFAPEFCAYGPSMCIFAISE